MLKLFLGLAVSEAKYFTLIQIHQEILEEPIADSLEDVNPSDYLPPIPTIDDLSMLEDLDFDFGLEGLGNSTSQARRERRKKPAE